MRSAACMFLTAVGVLLAGGCRSVEHVDAWKVQERPPIAYVGHGAFLDNGGNVVTPTPDLVLETQRYYIRNLYTKAGARERETFKVYRREVLSLAEGKTTAETILLNAAQLSWLLQNARVPNVEHVTSVHTALWGLVRPDVGKATPDEKPFRVAPDLYERLLPRIRLFPLYATPTGGPEYVEECRKVGVPLPPDWGSPQWQGPKALTTNFLLGVSTPIADMYVFEPENGMCAALPRHDGKTIKLLGVICMGVPSSKTCYWDNQRNKQQFDIAVGSTFSIVNDFAGGADLRNGSGGVCTDCHAGENPYIVHPADPAMNFAKELPAFWNQPLVHPAWPQNKGPNTALPGVALGSNDKSCLDCHTRPGGVQHRFPTVSTQTPGYCGTVLPNAFSTTMPSAGNTGPWMTHFNALQASCSKPPPGDGTVDVNGGLQADPLGGRTDTTGTLTNCPPGSPDCPVGFCYWRAVHGPFWQITPAGTKPEDPKYRGSFLRIFAEAGQWKWRAFSDTTGMAPNAPPGGVAECVAFSDLAGVTNGNASFGSILSVSDPNGTQGSQSINVTIGSPPENVFPLTGFIGNVAHVFEGRESDMLHVWENAGRVNLDHRHRLNPTTNYPAAPLTGESWTFGSPAWLPTYLAKDVLSMNDVELVAAANAAKARCHITGIVGAWSSTRKQGTQQPFAEILKASSGEIRLRVWPTEGSDRVWAYASCVALK